MIQQWAWKLVGQCENQTGTMSLVEDGSSVAGSAGHAVETQGVEEVPQVRACAVVVGVASLDGLNLHAIFRQRAVMRTVPSFLKRLTSCI